MRKLFLSLTAAFLLVSPALQAQRTDVVTKQNLEKHVRYLADDRLEGRLTGSAGEKLALGYIAEAFRKAGVKPAGTDGYSQPFDFTENTMADPQKTTLSINGKALVLNEDFYPLSASGNTPASGQVYFAGFGIQAPALNHDDYAGNAERSGAVFIIEISSPDGLHPHSKYAEYSQLDKKIETAIKYGATGIIFINNDNDAENPDRVLNAKIKQVEIPVVFIAKKMDYKSITDVKLQTALVKNRAVGHNVVGFIDNGAKHTVVIGAHYDHLGYGGEGSLYRGEKAIHNGADDNASGTSALIELARILKKSKLTANNYLFIAFSGEELGLLGSNAFAKSGLFDAYDINYMLNMDMVGRLDTDKVLIINGTGTSPAWNELLPAIQSGGIKIKATESGVGPSDHTSFYLKDIPVLHFFSGTHPDYHKPSDDADKINYTGMQEICEYMLSVIAQADVKGKLAFTKTRESEQGKVSAFKVTLGVVPDYAYEGEGLRIDGVSDGKPAAIAGLKAGDIVIKLGDEKVKDIYAYMAALGKFSKGDEVEALILRDGKEMKVRVKF